MPIHFDGDLVGIAKLVTGPEVPARTFSSAVSLLELVTFGICQDSLVSMLVQEVGTLRECVAQLRQLQSDPGPSPDALNPPAGIAVQPALHRENVTLVDSALSHLHGHYQTPGLSLAAVADALGCNPKYLTTRFTRIVGERMHAYLVRLRVAHACRLLMETAVPIKEVAWASGFGGSGALARAFRRQVGVSAGEYRRLFADR